MSLSSREVARSSAWALLRSIVTGRSGARPWLRSIVSGCSGARPWPGAMGPGRVGAGHLLTCLAIVGVLCASSLSARAQALEQRNVSLAQAMKIVNAVIAECSRPGSLVTVTVAVVDRAGLPVMQVRADTATTFSWELAYRKAYTALSIGRTSLEWRDMTAGDSELSGQRMLETLIPLGGGAPIRLGDEVIGGVGVSGARGGQPADSACAEMGAAAITGEG